MPALVPLFLALSLPHPALAIAPQGEDARRFGRLSEQGPGLQRVQRFHPGEQARLEQQLGWRSFVEAEGWGWQARFDQRTGLPLRAWGRGIPLASLDNQHEVESSLRQILHRHPGLLGIDPADLVLRRSGYVERTDTWHLSLEQRHQGYPVYRGSVEARVRFGKLIMLGVGTHPAIPELDPAQLSAETALELAIELGPAPQAAHEAGAARVVVLPYQAGSGLDYALAWEVRSETQAPRGKWVGWVDAHSGELLAMENEVLSLQGTVYGEHDVRNPAGGTATSAMPYIAVWSDDAGMYTDAAGAFELEGEAFTSRLQGSYFIVSNAAGAEGELSFSDGDGTWTSDWADQGEVDSYVFLHEVRDWALEFAPENPICGYQLNSYVNVSEATCNAWFDGDLNFGPEASGCNSSARLADVNYHEWGHGFHYWALQAGYFDSSASEGIADVVSVLQTDDPVIAPYFYQGSSQGIRDLDPDRVYPDDWVNESHADGLIFGGAVWDLLNIMREDYGEEEGWELTSQLFADAVPSGFTIPVAFDEFVAADDDDGDLSNGTPHYCQILEAFVPHGLSPNGGTSLITLSHVPVDNQTAGVGDYPVEAGVSELTSACFDVSFTGGELLYSLDHGESWDSVGLELSDTGLQGQIPEQEAGSVVHYYLVAESDDSSEAYVPAGGPINPFSFAVGDLVELYFEDFESDDGGYSHELLDGLDQDGADDWLWGTPQGMGGDPDFAYSGDSVWGNDLGGGNFNGEYQDDKHNQLSSGSIDVAPYNELLVQFQRWLQVEDGYYDQAKLLVDGELSWTNHATSSNQGDEHHEDLQWALASVISDDPDLDGLISLSWQIQSDGGLTFGGWNLDDVAVYAPPTPRNLMTIFDFEASEDAAGLDLSWTHPTYGDLHQVQVLYREDAFPTDHEDPAALVVLHVDSPVPGTAVTHTLTDAPAGEGYYAVFAGDGEGSWTRGGYPGYNADLGTPGAWNAGDGDPLDARPSCGCSTQPAPRSVALLLAGLLGLVSARRRR